MLISQAFPSEFLKAADLHDRQHTVVMHHVEIRDVGDGTKPVLFFENRKKGLVLNKVNSNNIALVYGDETDDWAGQELVIYPTMVDFQGRSVPAIRVKAAKVRARQTREPDDFQEPMERNAPEYPPRNGVTRPGIKVAAIAQTSRDLNDEVPF